MLSTRFKFHEAVRDEFYRCLDTPGTTMKKELKPGVWQWADASYNIIDSTTACRNDCVYCYVKPMNKRFGRKTEIGRAHV